MSHVARVRHRPASRAGRGFRWSFPFDSSDDRTVCPDEHLAEHDCWARPRPPRRAIHRRHLLNDAVGHDLLPELKLPHLGHQSRSGNPRQSQIGQTLSTTPFTGPAPARRHSRMPRGGTRPCRTRWRRRSALRRPAGRPPPPRSCRTISTRPCMPPAAPAWPAESHPGRVHGEARDAMRSSTSRSRSPSTM